MEKPTRLIEYTHKFKGRSLYLGHMRLTKFPMDVSFSFSFFLSSLF